MTAFSPFVPVDHFVLDPTIPNLREHAVDVFFPVGASDADLHNIAAHHIKQAATRGMGSCIYCVVRDPGAEPMIQFIFKRPMADRFIRYLDELNGV